MNNALSLSTLTPQPPSTSNNGRPPTIILQPNGDLLQESGKHFQLALQEAVELAAEGVIVDLLWVKQTDSDGIFALVKGIEKAIALGKTLSFKGMSTPIRLAMESEWERQRDIQFSSWSNVFKAELEAFLETNSR